ncbi:MAG TPA: hypothetical protein VMY88_09960 [Acidimicrobiales bacterium]|nr:hypothetical protein [Acidimicrobiales bacterium]
MRPRRSVTVALAASVTLLLAGGLAISSRAQSPTTGKQVALGLEAACADKTETLYATNEDATRVLGRWVTIAGPTFDLEPFEPRPGLTAHAVDPVDPRRLLVSEGESIQLSEDGGCTWKERHFEPPTYGVVGLQGELVVMDSIRQLEFAGRDRNRRAYALIAPDEDQAGAVRVLASDNAGADWEERSVGLPPLYTRYDSSLLICSYGPCATAVLAASPSDPDVAYVAVATQVTPSLYRTGDGGRSWQQISQTSSIGGQVSEMSVSAEDPDDLWIVFTDQLGRSRDGGVTWEFPQGLDRVAGIHLSSGVSPQQVQVLRRPDPFNVDPTFNHLMRSVDDGATFGGIELATPMKGVPATAPGGTADDLVLSTDRPDGVVQFDAAARRFADISVPGLGDVTSPRRDATAEPAWWFRQFAGLATFVPGQPPGPVPRAKLPFKPFEAATVDPGRVPGSLEPADLDIELGREGTQVVDYGLDLPALPTPVDIWFLIDTSGSMSGAIEGLRQGFETIIEELSASGFDAWFGLATFPAQQVIYDRQADIAPPNPELYDALERLDTDGATAEIHATALYQSVTGAGQEDAGIPAGRGATFRPQALKIIVHATDEAYGTDSTGPSIDEAAEALAAAGVRHVGLDLAAGAGDPTAGVDGGGVRSTKRDHDSMALATNTLAPREGIDCNGDGKNELEEGDPITCPILRGQDSLEITPAIVSAVRGIRDDTAVALTVVDAGGLNVEIGEPVRSPVNVKVPNALPFAVRYTCPSDMTGKVAQVVLRATVRGVPAADAVAKVGCGVAVPAVAPPRPHTPAALVPMVVAPPQLALDLEPGLSPLSQTSPAQVAQPSAQAGLATQPGEVVTAKQKAGRDGPAPPSPESGNGREQSSAPATAGTIGAGGMLAVALGGWAVRRERRGVPVGVRA